MSPKAKNIFAEACEKEADEREAFLAEACGDDAELRLEVQRLVVDAERAEELFGDEDETQADDLNLERGAECEGDVIGPYTLRQEIGEGGFGVVWMAEQSQPIRRMVALKVVKAGMDTRQVLARFEAERQAVALMDHPNIAKVLDAGATASGRPYFAMELVKGIPITAFCDQQKYGPRRRLELFRDVCSAINHAHQKGVIHRDLKPSNVMVTLLADQPVVKVIDFGIAKATHSNLTDKTLFTRYEQFLGTPAYMSPEQAALSAVDVDTRSDIYSLGVLLYELLAGAPPFDQKTLLSAGYDEMRRIIAEDEPPKPSTRATQTQSPSNPTNPTNQNISPHALRGDLDWIVMKAIEKDRTRRYETANAFAADIGRYLEDEPVLAAAPSATYKFRKFARRNKAALGVAAGFALVLLAATAVSTWQAWQATQARTDSEAARELAEASRHESEQARLEAEHAYTFLLDAIQSADLSRAEGDREITLVEILADAGRRLKTEFADRPERSLKLQDAMAKTYASLGKYSEAIALYEQMRDHYRDDPAHPDALELLFSLAHTHKNASQEGKAADITDEAFRLAKDAHGEKHPLALEAMHHRVRMRVNAGRTEGLEAMAKELFALCSDVHGPEAPETIAALHQLAHASPVEQRLGLHEEVVALAEGTLGTQHKETLSAMHCLATALEPKDPARVIDLREKVVAGYEALDGAVTPRVLYEMGFLVTAHKRAGQTKKAMAWAEERWKLSHQRLGPDHPDTVSALAKIGVSPGADGEAAARRLDFEQAAREKMALRASSSNPQEVGRYGILLLHLGETEEFVELVTAALERLKEKQPSAIAQLCFLAPDASWRSDELILGILENEELSKVDYRRRLVGMGHYRLGKYAEAEGELDEALKNITWLPHRVEGLAFLAMARFKSGQPEEAKADLDRAKVEYIQRHPRPGALLGEKWNELLAMRLALKEALETIEGNSEWLPEIGQPFPAGREFVRFLLMAKGVELERQFAAPGFEPNPMDALKFAALLAYQGDQARHLELAEQLLPQFGEQEEALSLDQLAKATFLMSPPDGQPTEEQKHAWASFLRIREIGRDWFEGVFRPAVRLDRGLGAYRNNDHLEVGAALNDEFIARYPAPFVAVYAHSVRAMSRWQASEGPDANQNFEEAAKSDLEKAKKRYTELELRIEEAGWWDKFVIPHVLLREALETIEGNSDWLEQLSAGNAQKIAQLPQTPAPIKNLQPTPKPKPLLKGFFQVDLTDHYNTTLNAPNWATDAPIDLSRLPETFLALHGVKFALEGAIRLESGNLPGRGKTINEILGLDLQSEVKGIEVSRASRRIHFLTSCQWGGRVPGEKIAHFVMHYEDGTEATMDVVIGPKGVDDWVRDEADIVVGWKGPIDPKGRRGALSELIWENPHPDKVIKAIDFVSELSPHGAPFLVAITLE